MTPRAVPTRIRDELRALAEPSLQAFTAKLVPTVETRRILGIRIPAMRKLAKKLRRQRTDDVESFLNNTPHFYLEENLLHALILNEERDFDTLIEKLEAFFPQIDNWMVSDIVSPVIMRKNRARIEPLLQKWIASNDVYTLRVGCQLLMSHFLDEDFSPHHLQWVASVDNSDYYAQMVCAWYFATALAKQEDATWPYFLGERSDPADESDGRPRPSLDPVVRKMAIQKAVESRRITPDKKEELRTLRSTLSH